MRKNLYTKHSALIRRLTVGVAALAAGIGIVGAVQAQTYTMKISTPTINELQHDWAKKYKELLEKKTDNKIKVEIYPASQLGSNTNVIEGVQLGSIEATLTPYEFFAGVDRRYQVPGMPGLFSSMQDAYNKLTSPEVREVLMNIGKDKGLVGISTVVYGPQIFLSKEPIKTLDDFSNKKLRVLASEIEVQSVQALNGSPVPMPLNEVASGLQQGAIDGANTLYDVVVPTRMYSFAPHVLESDLWYVVVHVAVSDAWYKQLPEDLQKAVVDAAKELEPVILQHQLDRQEKAKEDWRANGGTSNFLSEEELKVAQDRTAKVTTAYLEGHPELREIYELIQNAGSNN